MEGQATGGEGGGQAAGSGQTGQAPAAGAGGEGAGNQGGLFGSLALKLPAAEGNAEGGEGVAQTGQDDPAKQGATGSQTTPQKLFAGKFKTQEEFEKAYESSGQEAFRLFLKNKEISQEHEKLSLRAKQLEADLAAAKQTQQSAFKELSPEAVKELKENNPSDYAEYLNEKRWHEEKTAQAKDALERQKKEDAREQENRQKQIFSRIREMESDAENYPDFKTLQPVMDELIDLTEGTIAGHAWSPEIAYLAALGVKTLQSNKQSSTEKRKADEEAKRKAGAAAQGSRSAGAGAEGGAPKTPGDDSDEALNAGIIASGPKSHFGW